MSVVQDPGLVPSPAGLERTRRRYIVCTLVRWSVVSLDQTKRMCVLCTWTTCMCPGNYFTGIHAVADHNYMRRRHPLPRQLQQQLDDRHHLCQVRMLASVDLVCKRVAALQKILDLVFEYEVLALAL
jgi:hypothetical protein